MTRRLLCPVLSLLWACSAALPAIATTNASSEVYVARVSRVFDGDTVWVQPLDGGRYRKLRIDGIDAPEICQAGGTASRDALAGRVMDQMVTVSVRQHDDYGRGLAKLTHQGADVAAWMVLQGHAWSYRWRRSLGPYREQEEMARRASKGLFADGTAELPRAFRQRHGPCMLP
ncbi:thermonuclease family protein [Hydrogenophaga laconesensis]|uniref:Endonuclease YncB(Thermonuclease family) n=1 Tax=Hydrogenophaga laconesensis TaxID=1805971 RepID=A0ABU1VAP3_9BURK|nr:thermonuclease family protein [Hydrogenophaga laconesensis]MDR7094534.1 endonuclease YncB(thermonuclease family) [Hydrogenophaga laconesensis]